MGKPTGFLEFPRQDRSYVAVSDRVVEYEEFMIPLEHDVLQQQGARCMDCGIPFCHQGCPVNNIIPDWNDLVYKGKMEAAIEVLHSTILRAFSKTCCNSKMVTFSKYLRASSSCSIN